MSDTIGHSSISYSKELENDLSRFAQQLIPPDTPSLWAILGQIAVTGLTCYSWQDLAKLIEQKIFERLDELRETCSVADLESHKYQIQSQLYSLPGPPFTIQRLCELLVVPEKWNYRTVARYSFAVQKTLTVTTTLETLSPDDFNALVQLQVDNMKNVMASKLHHQQNEESEEQFLNDETPVLVADPVPHTDTPIPPQEEISFAEVPEEQQEQQEQHGEQEQQQQEDESTSQSSQEHTPMDVDPR